MYSPYSTSQYVERYTRCVQEGQDALDGATVVDPYSFDELNQASHQHDRPQGVSPCSRQGQKGTRPQDDQQEVRRGRSARISSSWAFQAR